MLNQSRRDLLLRLHHLAARPSHGLHACSHRHFVLSDWYEELGKEGRTDRQLSGTMVHAGLARSEECV